jgi:hypothetical protein
VPWLERRALGPGAELAGPAILSQADATTWLADGWRARAGSLGELLLERLSAGGALDSAAPAGDNNLARP